MAQTQLAGGQPARTTPSTPSSPSSPASNGGQSFRDVLQSLIGRTVTVVTAESYEAAPVGHQLRAGFYPAKAIGLGQDVLILRSERKPPGKKEAEPVKQLIPIDHIRRVSVMKSELVLHL